MTGSMTRWRLSPLLALTLLAGAPAHRVVDGDTLVVAGETIRLWGVDAPEGRQTCRDALGRSFGCGDVARDQLHALVTRGALTCQTRDQDGYGRRVAQCQVGGRDLGDALVRGGWAVESRTFSRGAYSAAEAEARGVRRGLWAGQFDQPAAWRARQRAAAPAPPPPPGRCAIKGNINAKGRRIFHSPGQQDYAATTISEAKGERWFCSAAEATAAGWIPAQR